jgi:hypothetical protein
LIGQCEYNESTGSYLLTGDISATWLLSQGVYTKVKCWFLHENPFLNQILGYFEKSKRRNGLFIFVNKAEWQTK